MNDIGYLNFTLKIGSGSGKRYPVSVLSSSAGEANGTFQLPFTTSELERIETVIELAMLRSRQPTRRVLSPEMEELRGFGKRLFNAVFQGPVKATYDSSLHMALSQSKGLRIRLRIEAPELVRLPWEFLYSEDERRFLILSTKTPLVRYMELLYPTIPLAVEHPLRILVMVSNPKDHLPLDVDREKRRINEAVAHMTEAGLVQVEFLEEATLPALQNKLREGEFHIMHFIGHGGYDAELDEGILILEGESGRGRYVGGEYLGRLLSDHFSLRLVVLNACEGGRTSNNDPFAGAAVSLVEAGIPAVIAMQFEITDRAAVIFAQEFYAAIADSYPVDAAVAEGRKAIEYSIRNTLEWATPVLYMRSPDGLLFQLPPGAMEEEDQDPLVALYQQATEALQDQRWHEGLDLLREITAQDADYRDALEKLAEVEVRLSREQQSVRYRELLSAVATVPLRFPGWVARLWGGWLAERRPFESAGAVVSTALIAVTLLLVLGFWVLAGADAVPTSQIPTRPATATSPLESLLSAPATPSVSSEVVAPSPSPTATETPTRTRTTRPTFTATRMPTATPASTAAATFPAAGTPTAVAPTSTVTQMPTATLGTTTDNTAPGPASSDPTVTPTPPSPANTPTSDTRSTPTFVPTATNTALPRPATPTPVEASSSGRATPTPAS